MRLATFNSLVFTEKTRYGCQFTFLVMVCIFGSVSASAAETTRIMPLGDSITRGSISIHPGVVPGGYRAKLWENLKAAGYGMEFVGVSNENPSPGNPSASKHCGFNGIRIEQIDNQIIPWLKKCKPSVILMHLGTNDAIQNYDFDNVAKRLDKLITDITTQLPQTHLIVAQVILSKDPATQSRIESYNKQVREVVQRHANKKELVTLVDMHSVVPVANFADLHHPNKAGYDQMADAWFKAIHSLGLMPANFSHEQTQLPEETAVN